MHKEHYHVMHNIQALASNKSSGQCITVLREVQTLLGTHATLDDLMHIVQNVEHEFGSQTQLETAIQSLVGQNLEQQVTVRKQRLRG